MLFVSGAGDRLEDLTSRDGDWFLDELTSISGNVNYMLGMLTNNAAVSFSRMTCNQTRFTVYHFQTSRPPTLDLLRVTGKLVPLSKS